MRAISKNLAHLGYRPLAGRAPPVSPEAAETAWRKFGGKPSVLHALLQEQFYLCCYSEIRADQAELGYHIEHVENKSQNPSRTFDPGNLAASAIHSDELPQFKPEGGPEITFGGHAPGKRLACDMQRFVSCHQPDCASYFVFLSDGRMLPRAAPGSVEYERAQYTLDVLNLNSAYLVNRRRRWWQELQAALAHADEDLAQWTVLAKQHLLPEQGKLYSFFSLTRQFFGEVGERVLNAAQSTVW